MPFDFNMVGGLGGPWAKRALGSLISGSKDHGTHIAPLFLGWDFVLFRLGKILCFKPRVWKVERAGKLMSTSNTPEGEARLFTKRVGSTHFPICLWRMMF